MEGEGESGLHAGEGLVKETGPPPHSHACTHMHTKTHVYMHTHARICVRALGEPRSTLPPPAGILATLPANPLPAHEQVRISGLKTWGLSETAFTG